MPALYILLTLGLLLTGAASIVLVPFNRKRRFIARCAADATDTELERIYSLMDSIGSEESNGFVLARTNHLTPHSKSVIYVPDQLKGFPWSGQRISIEEGADMVFNVSTSSSKEICLKGRSARPVRIPRMKLQSGKLRNVYSPRSILKGNGQLLQALSAVCARYPEELLSYLLCIGRESFEFDSSSQARIGSSPTWVQSAEHQSCDECRSKLSLILQLPGSALRDRKLGDATLYLFGCKKHPHLTKTLLQYD